jgi:hypothetical protein
MDFEKALGKNIGQTEVAALRQASIVSLNGVAKFEDNIEHSFSFGSVLLKY